MERSVKGLQREMITKGGKQYSSGKEQSERMAHEKICMGEDGVESETHRPDISIQKANS